MSRQNNRGQPPWSGVTCDPAGNVQYASCTHRQVHRHGTGLTSTTPSPRCGSIVQLSPCAQLAAAQLCHKATAELPRPALDSFVRLIVFSQLHKARFSADILGGQSRLSASWEPVLQV